MVKIKREKIKGKYYITARNSKGRIIDRIIAKKGMTEKKASEIYRKNRTLDEKKIRHRLTNVYEVVDYNRKKPGASIADSYQYVISADINRKRIHVRSEKIPISMPVDYAREQAYESFYRSVADSMGYDYDETIGESLFNEISDANISEGVIYYEKV